MYIARMPIFRKPLVFALLCLISSAACNRDSGGKTNAEAPLDLEGIQVRRLFTSSFRENEEVPQKLQVAVQVCLLEPATQQPIALQSFRVGFRPANVAVRFQAELVSDNRGCLFWSSPLEFNYFDSESWLPYQIDIEGVNTPYEGLRRSKQVLVNPWKRAEILSLDPKLGPLPVLNSNAPSIGLQEMTYVYQGQNYKIDQSMQLTLEKKFQLRIKPYLSRPRASDPQGETETLPSGLYRLKTYLVHPSGDNDESHLLLSQTEKVVRCDNGMIVDNIILPIRFSNLPEMALRNRLVLSLETLSPDGLSPAWAATEIQLNGGHIFFGLEKLSPEYVRNTLASVLAQGDTKQPRLSAKSFVKKMTKAKELSLEKLSDYDLSEESFSSADSGHRHLYFIHNVGAVSQNPTGTSHSLRATAAFIKEGREQHVEFEKGSYRSIVGLFAEARAKLDVFFMSLATVGRAGREMYTGIEDSSGVNWRQRFDVADLTILNVEEMNIDFEASFEDCLLVQKNKMPSALFCKKDLITKNVNESWFYIYQDQMASSQALRDLGRQGQQPWASVVRGKSRYLRLRNLLEDKARRMVLIPEGRLAITTPVLKNSFERWRSNIRRGFTDGALSGVIEN